MRLREPGDEQPDHPTGVVARIATDPDAEVAGAAQELEGIQARVDLSGGRCGIEELGTHRHEAVEKVGVRRCALSPSMPTCGTSPAATSTTASGEALSWTNSAPRSVGTPASITRLDPSAGLLRAQCGDQACRLFAPWCCRRHGSGPSLWLGVGNSWSDREERDSGRRRHGDRQACASGLIGSRLLCDSV